MGYRELCPGGWRGRPRNLVGYVNHLRPGAIGPWVFRALDGFKACWALRQALKFQTIKYGELLKWSKRRDSKFCRVSGTGEAGRPRKCWGFWNSAVAGLVEF